MPAASVADPFAELVPQNLIGGENGAPAFQTVGAEFSQVPKAEVAAPTELGAFADLVPTDAPSARSMDFGPFTDLVPVSPTSETEKALAETPHWQEASIRSGSDFGTPLDAVSTIGRWVDKLFEPGTTHPSGPLIPPDAARTAVNVLGYANPVGLTARVMGGKAEEAVKAVEGSVADAVSGASSLEAIAQLPSFAVPGVAEAYALGVLAKLPEQYGRISEAIHNHGLTSMETVKAAADAGIQDLMGFLAVKGSHLVRGGGIEEAPVRPASASGDIPAPERGAVPETVQGAQPANGATAADRTADVVPPAEELPGNDWTRATEEPVAAAEKTEEPRPAKTPVSPEESTSSEIPVSPIRQEGEVSQGDVALSTPKSNPQPETTQPAETGNLKSDNRTIEAARRNIPFGETAVNDPVKILKEQGSDAYRENSDAMFGLSQAVGTRRSIEMASGKVPYPTRAEYEILLNRSFDNKANDLRTDIVHKLRTLGIDPASTDLPHPNDFKTGREFYESMFEASSKMRNSGANLAASLGFKFDKPAAASKSKSPSGSLRLKPGSEAGFIDLSGAADAIDTAKEKTGLNIGGKADDLNLATAARSAKLQESFADAERAQKEIRKAVPDEKRQGAISVYIEANGDQNTLATWASQAKGKMFKQAVDAARDLTPEEVAIAQKVGQTFGVLEQRGNKYDVLNAHRDNYVPHEWDVTKNFSGIGSSKLKDSFKFNKARTFNNFFEGDQAGFTPKTLAIGKLLPAYLHEMNTVIADRQFVQDAAKGMSSEGTPLLIPRGRVSTVEKASGGKATLADPHAIHGMKDAAGNPIDQRAYKVISDQPALSDWRWEGKDAAGNPVFMRDDLAAHPELAKRLNAMMGDSAVRKWYNEPSTGLSTVPRAIVKGLDTAQSVMKREMFGLLAPFHQVQEGTHAVGHTVNPTFGLEKMDRPTPAMVDGMQHGLMLMPEKAGGAGYMEGVGGSKGFISQIARKFGGKAGEMVAGTIDGYQNYLFHQYIPSLKWKTYEHVVARNLKRYAGDMARGEVTPADVKMLSAEQVNAAYGHLNYALLDRNPTIQHFLQVGLLAPDFLEARGRFVGQAVKSIASKSGHEQFRAIAVLAAAQAGTAIVLSKLMGDEWDPKHPFEVTHNGRTYTLRSVPEDLMRLLFSGTDTRREFVSARINPMAQKGIQSLTGRNYRGEKVGFIDTMEELLANYIPITARQIPGIRSLTETSRNSPTSPLEQLAGSLGLKISRHSPIQKTYQLANQWKKDTGLPADTGSYPVSKYQQLRYALEDGDFDKARTEYDKLISAGEKKAKIGPGFKESVLHPFTGSLQTDTKFRQSLSAEDRVTFDAAVKRRHEILQRFGRIH